MTVFTHAPDPPVSGLTVLCRRLAVLVLCACCIAPARASVLDILPGDVVARAPGSYALAAYLAQRSSAGPYRSGALTGNARVGTDIAAVRLTGYGVVAGMRWAWSVMPSWSTAQLAEGGMPVTFGRNAAGSADVRLSATLWPVADLRGGGGGENRSLTVAWFEPTGNYSNQRVLNIGENRRKLAFLAGWSAPMTQSLRLEVVPELAFYGDNHDYLNGKIRTQDNTLALTSYLRLHLAPQWEVQAGAQFNGGGETSVNGARQNDLARNTRLMLGASHLLARDTLVSLRYGVDTRIENGMRLDREWLFRLAYRF